MTVTGVSVTFMTVTIMTLTVMTMTGPAQVSYLPLCSVGVLETDLRFVVMSPRRDLELQCRLGLMPMNAMHFNNPESCNRPLDYLAMTDCGRSLFSAATVLGIVTGLAFSRALSPAPPSVPNAMETATLKAGCSI